MSPDIKINQFYHAFIHKYTEIYKEKLAELKELEHIKNITYSYIKRFEDTINNILNIDLSTYEQEWVKQEAGTALHSRVNKLDKTKYDDRIKILIIQLTKYCNTLDSIKLRKDAIEFAVKCKSIKFSDYRDIVNRYYYSVHGEVLQGHGYRFPFGVGIFVINRWENKFKKTIVDYNASNLKKKQLLAEGKKVYNPNEAAWYEARHIPYDAVDYRVYRCNSHVYEFTFIKSTIASEKTYEFEHTEYISKKYRGMSQIEVADIFCKTREDIYNLQVDIKYKLNMLLYKFPTDYTNFIRNETQNKYQHIPYYRKNR